MTAPRPGWYPDPAGTAQLYRWWDGETWTGHLGDSSHAPAPQPLAPTAPVERAEEAELPLELQVAPDHLTSLAGRRSTSRAVVAVAVGFALFVSAGVGAGVLLWRDTPATGGATAGRPVRQAAPSASAPPAVGRLDQSSRQARIGRATITLPPAPYRTSPDPRTLAGIFDVYFMAGCTVHERYDKKHDWSAMVALTQLSPQLVSGSSGSRMDLEQAGEHALEVLARHFFDGHATTVKPVSSSDRSVDGNPGLQFGVAVHYSVKGLASRYDRVTALVVRLDDGTIIAAISSVPDDADPEVSRLAAASLETLTIS